MKKQFWIFMPLRLIYVNIYLYQLMSNVLDRFWGFFNGMVAGTSPLIQDGLRL